MTSPSLGIIRTNQQNLICPTESYKHGIQGKSGATGSKFKHSQPRHTFFFLNLGSIVCTIRFAICSLYKTKQLKETTQEYGKKPNQQKSTKERK